MNKIIIENIESLYQAASWILELINDNNKIFCIYGDMGSGKTTLIKEVCKLLNVKENVTSPTFSIVNEYLSEENGKIYHFDLYRIKNLKEVFDIGIEEYFNEESIIFIEWPQVAESIIPYNHTKIIIVENTSGHRIISKIQSL